MKIESMETPTTRSEFEHRFHLLENIMKNGKISIARGISMESMLKVRQLPNGRIDFLSVDETARLKANMMLHMQNINFPQDLDSSSQDEI